MAFEKANKDYFDKMSSDYESAPWQKEMTKQLTHEMRNRIQWMGLEGETESNANTQKRLLDYACGTGTMTRSIGPYVNEVRGIDLSDKMVEQYNARAAEAGLAESKVHAVQGNLLAKDTSEALKGIEFHNFDIAIIGLGFHHFALETQVTACRELGKRLKPGGILLIVDFFHAHDNHGDKLSDWPDEARRSVSTTGFTSKTMESIYTEAGFTDYAIEVFEKPFHMEFGGKPSQKTCFMTKGTRA